MINWKQNVLEAFKHSGRSHYKIYAGVSAKGNCMFSSDDESTAAQAQTKLAQQLDLIYMPGKYLIQFKNGTTASANIMEYPFDIPYGYGSQQAPAMGNTMQMAGMVPADHVERELTKAREKWELEKRLDEMKTAIGKVSAELKEARKNESPLATIAEDLKPYYGILAPVIARLFGGNAPMAMQAGISGVAEPEVQNTFHETGPQQQAPQLTPEQQQQMMQNRAKLQAVMQYLVELKGNETEAAAFLYRLMLTLKANPTYLQIIEPMLVKEDKGQGTGEKGQETSEN